MSLQVDVVVKGKTTAVLLDEGDHTEVTAGAKNLVVLRVTNRKGKLRAELWPAEPITPTGPQRLKVVM